MVNKEKTEYIILSQKNYNQQSVYGILFKYVTTFKYFEIDLNANGDNCREIQQKINMANRRFFILKSVFNSKFFS